MEKIIFVVLILLQSVAYGFNTPTLEISETDGSYKIKAEITAYYYLDDVDASGTGIAADGTPAVPEETIAVDIKYIPLGSKVYIPTQGWRRANDTGSAVTTEMQDGEIVTTIDLCKDSKEKCYEWGRKTMTVTVIPPKKRITSRVIYPDNQEYKLLTLDDVINELLPISQLKQA